MIRFAVIALVTTVAFTACNTATQLTVDTDAVRSATKLGVKAEDIQFLTYTDFSAVTEPELKKIIGENGILALTDSQLCLFVRNSKFFFSKDRLTVPYSDMKGIFFQGDQIQLKYRDLMMILEIRDPKTRSADGFKQEELYQRILAQGIPEFDGFVINEITRYRRQRDRFLSRDSYVSSGDNDWQPPIPQE